MCPPLIFEYFWLLGFTTATIAVVVVCLVVWVVFQIATILCLLPPSPQTLVFVWFCAPIVWTDSSSVYWVSPSCTAFATQSSTYAWKQQTGMANLRYMLDWARLTDGFSPRSVVDSCFGSVSKSLGGLGPSRLSFDARLGPRACMESGLVCRTSVCGLMSSATFLASVFRYQPQKLTL